jgi:hypothetical protein
MIYIVAKADTGEIVGRSSESNLFLQPHTYHVVSGAGEPAVDYVADIGNGPEILPRPLISPLTEDTPGVWEATGCPDDLEIVVWDIDLGVILAEVPQINGVIQIALPDPGSYKLISKAPFPYINITQIIEVE